MKRHLFHDNTYEEKFFCDGFVIIDLLNQTEVNQIYEELFKLQPHDNFGSEGGPVHCTFLDSNIDYKLEVNHKIRALIQPKAEALLLDYEFFYANLFVKPPKSLPTPMHGDWTSTSAPHFTTINIWCPLLDVSRENGTLEIIPGSHKIVPDVFSPGTPYFFDDIQSILVQKYTQAVNLKAGQALVFDNSLIHYAAENQTEIHRPVLQYVANPKEMTPVYYHFDTKNPHLGYEVFKIEFGEWYLKRHAATVMERPEKLESFGFKPFHQRHLTEANFLEMMDKGPETRTKLFQI